MSTYNNCTRPNCACKKKCPKPQKSSCSFTGTKKEVCVMRCHTISFKPREFIVHPKDSGKQTLDDVVDKLQSFKGGYVIKMAPGVHELTKNIGGVDRLELQGDLSPNKGVAYLQGANYLSFIADNVVGKWMPYDSKTGNGPWSLNVSGATITVTGDRDPSFSSVCVGDRVGILKKNGTITQFTIKHASGNSITLNASSGLSGTPLKGEGFYIYPRVTLKTNSSRTYYVEKTFFRGVHFDTKPLFRVGQVSGRITYAYCVLEGNTNWDGTFECDLPNVNLGTLTGIAASHGTVTMWANLGRKVNMHFESNGFPYVIASVTAGCALGLKLVIGGKMCVAFSQFLNCDKGVKLLGGGHLNAQGNLYHCCDLAIDADTYCGIGSEALPDFPFPAEAWPPTFNECSVAIKLEHGCHGHFPDLNDSFFTGVGTAMIIDGNSFTNFSDYTNRDIQSKGSVVITDFA